MIAVRFLLLILALISFSFGELTKADETQLPERVRSFPGYASHQVILLGAFTDPLEVEIFFPGRISGPGKMPNNYRLEVNVPNLLPLTVHSEWERWPIGRESYLNSIAILSALAEDRLQLFIPRARVREVIESFSIDLKSYHKLLGYSAHEKDLWVSSESLGWIKLVDLVRIWEAFLELPRLQTLFDHCMQYLSEGQRKAIEALLQKVQRDFDHRSRVHMLGGPIATQTDVAPCTARITSVGGTGLI
ncbi:MAG: hypothetical protein EA369_04650 [Bradymonadales bacterium]|nr:MAG: hypothetical protein EA369_04650 [Bradymonadales bacterium]